jgi:hypothetical protein
MPPAPPVITATLPASELSERSYIGRRSRVWAPGQQWHLDHNNDPQRLPRPLPRNLQPQSRRKQDQQQEKEHPLIWSRVWYEPIPPDVILSSSGDEARTRIS